jgi:hypothetical protein
LSEMFFDFFFFEDSDYNNLIPPSSPAKSFYIFCSYFINLFLQYLGLNLGPTA